ncbi:MAG TPA: TonB-dependent receptor, partial [Gemmatimonadaceae bacterium]|nr:TonB-dependent receptor [Gemmatimonadaceae bacterium]
MARRISLIVAALICLSSGVAGAQERFGGLAGTVTDETKGALPGTTVTATNVETGAQRVVVSSADGSYRVPDLEPGRYSVAFELDTFQKVVMNDVLVLLGRTVGVDAQMKVGGIQEALTVTADSAKQLDLTKVTLAHNITAEEFDRLPKARSFQGLALTAPGVNAGEIEGGLQVNGASAAENQFTVDGVAINSLIYGNSRQNTVFEYLQEVQVKTGGIDAEYGGALGGVVSAVTKSGGNTFSGETHYYYIGSALSAGPFKRLQLDPNTLATAAYYQDEKQSNNQSEFGGSLGGPIVKDKLFFFGSVSPRVVRRTNEYLFSAGTEPGEISQKQTAWQGFGKVTYAANKVHANASLLMTPTRSEGRLPAYDGTGTNWLTTSAAANQAETTRGFEGDQNNFSSNVDIWLRNNSYLSARAGYFYDAYKD